MPIGCAAWSNKLQPWDAKVREPVLIGRVPFEPAYPEDLNLLSPRSPDNLLCTFVVDGNCEDVDKSAVVIRMGAIVVGRGDHNIGPRAEVGNI